MGICRLFLLAAIISISVWAATFNGISQTRTQSSTAAAREEAYRANNVGVALLEQFKYKEATVEFRRALKLYPSLGLARVNLAIALFNVPDVEASLLEAKAAETTNTPQIYYLLGLIARGQNRTVDAIAAFKRVLEIDPRDPGANINVGQLYVQQRNYADGIAAFRAALDSENYNVTAIYNLGIALTRSGQREEGARAMQQFQKLREGGYGTTIGQNYLEQGRYAEAISSTGMEADLAQTAMPEVTFTDATQSALPTQAKAATGNKEFFGRPINAAQWNDATRRELLAATCGGVTLFDYDNDGDLDMFDVGPDAQRLCRNDGGKFVDVTSASGLPANAAGINAVAGDYDNDNKPDLFVLRYNGSTLYHNDGNGKFSDATQPAGIPAYSYLALSAAMVDVDHDGDLDLFIAGFADLGKTPTGGSLTFPDDFAGAPNLLLRNNGNGKFTDITEQAKIAGANGHAVAIVATDYDNHRDVDLLVVNYNEAPVLFANQRDGTFRNVAQEVGLTAKARFTCVAAGDVNKDDYTDFFFGKADGAGLFAMSDGRGRFVASTAVAETESATAAQFLDYDNDGLLDLALFSNTGARVFRNLAGKWENAGERTVTNELRSQARAFASADIDCDGDTDIIARLTTGELKVARNDGGNRNRSLRIQLAGRVSNRSAVGAKIEVRAGSLKQKLETSSASPAFAPADTIFGLGTRTAVDALRVLWPAGIVQSETEIAPPADKKCAHSLTVTELDRKPSSCPYLYTWNGERFEFVTDFMGGGEMGYWEAPGKRNHPDPDEYVRIRGDQLKERNGRYELRVTNELEEVLYVDRLQLIAVAHPADTEVYPNEGMIDPPLPPFKLYTTRGARAPLAATDDHGHDVLSRIAKPDRQFPDDFALLRIRGYAEEHTLTLDLGEVNKDKTLLLLTGWTDYAFSSDNVAAHQSKLEMMPPALQVKDAEGRWQTVIANIGVPVGRPQTVTVDLAGRFLSKNREVRIVTNMRIYWDQILVDDSTGNDSTAMTRLDPVVADLGWRGFSAEVNEPFDYDYARVSSQSPWKTAPGRYTREGDVRQLLARTDDMFVVSRPGDEIVLSFDATKLPPLPAGWKRTFLLYADGFSKEMDINSASPDAVAPLPFHGMKNYPYGADESYPMTKARLEYIEQYNTRIVAAPVQKIEATFTVTRSHEPEVRSQKKK
ncbi:MAG: FG-GAP-like repeat-containing protein [Blastocatellia bacterium]